MFIFLSILKQIINRKSHKGELVTLSGKITSYFEDNHQKIIAHPKFYQVVGDPVIVWVMMTSHLENSKRSYSFIIKDGINAFCAISLYDEKERKKSFL